MLRIDEVRNLPRSVTLKGGFFCRGMRWREYYDKVPYQYRAHIAAIKTHVVRNQLRHTGREYEKGAAVVPVFADGTTAFFTKRGYADLMAAIWSDVDGVDYSYVHYLNFLIDPFDLQPPAVDTALTRGGCA
jgi:hypothetical protein